MDTEVFYNDLCEKLNSKSGEIQPYVSHEDKESSILFDIKWKGEFHFVVVGWTNFGWYYVSRNNETISESYHFQKIDEALLKSMQKVIDEMEDGKYKNKKTLSEKIKVMIENRNLTSYMNKTKWHELFTSIKEQMYEIPIRYKTLLDAETPDSYWTMAGDEYLEHINTAAIEWFMIEDQIKVVQNRGRLQEPKVLIFEKNEEILQILTKYAIPYEYDEAEHSFTIYGYK